eukprot:3933059-Rhodomonas_salina.1
MPKFLRTDGAGETNNPEFEKLLLSQGMHHEKSAADHQFQDGLVERKVSMIKGCTRSNSIHANSPAKFWQPCMVLSGVLESVTRPYKKGSTMTPFERHYGKPFPSHLLKPFGCWAKVHTGKNRTGDTALAQRGKPGIHLGFAFHLGFSAYLIYHQDSCKTSKVPFNQVTFDKEYFPWRNPAGQKWPPMEFREEDDLEVIEEGEEGEMMEDPHNEPFILKSVRTRAQKAALDAEQMQNRRALESHVDQADAAAGQPQIPKQPEALNNFSNNLPPLPEPNVLPGPMDQYFDEAMLVLAAFSSTPPSIKFDVVKNVNQSTDAETADESRGVDLENSTAVYAMAAEHRQALGVKAENPKTFKQAIQGKNTVHWMGAAKVERDILEEKGVFSVLEEQELDDLIKEGANILTGKTAVKEKVNEDGDFYKPKCSVVLHIASGTAIRSIVSLGVGSGARFGHLDVKEAYLNSQNPIKQHMWVPYGVAKGKRECWEVLKSLYWKRRAGADWKGTLVPVLLAFGFEAATADETVFILREGEKFIIIAIYVDDTVYAETWPEKTEEFKTYLDSVFETNNEGELAWFLSVRYKWNETRDILSLSQTTFVEKLLSEYEMENMKSTKTPMAEDFVVLPGYIQDKVDPELKAKCQSLEGSLLFIAMWSSPDISQATSYLSRFVSNQSEKIYAALKRVLRYLKGTAHYGVGYTSNPDKMRGFKPNELWGYVDSLYANDEINCKSTMGYCLYLNGGLVSWKTKLSPVIALSTADAEFIAACFAACEIMFLHQFLAALGFPQTDPTCLYEDNAAAIYLATEPGLSPRTKHIDVRFMYLVERVKARDLQLIKCPGTEMTADLLTKPLGTIKFGTHASNMCTNHGEYM